MSKQENTIQGNTDEKRQAAALPPTGEQPLILYDFATIVGAVYLQRITVTKQEIVTKRFVDQLRPYLHGLPRFDKQHVDTYVNMLFRMAQQLRLIKIVSSFYEGKDKPYYRPATDLGLKEWSQSNIYDQARQFIAEWRMNTEWHDIWSADIKQWDVTDWNPLAARGLLIDIFSSGIYQTERSYSIASLLDLLWAKGPYSLRPTHYMRKSRMQNIPIALRQYWEQCEGVVYRGILASTLSELGIVSITKSTSKPTTSNPSLTFESFKLTEFGASVLATEHRVTTSTAVRRILMVQPTCELILPEFDPPTLYRLLPFMHVNLIEQASRLTATKQSVLRGIEFGIDVGQMIGTLKAASRKALPQNVIRTIKDWAKTYKGAEISEVLHMRVSSESLADELCSTTQLQKYGLEKIAPRRLLAHHVYDHTDFLQVLKSAGIVIRDEG